MAGGKTWSVGCLKLPQLDQATIRSEKISDYLLSPTHPVGRHKARFFQQFGFAQSNPETLRSSLLAHARLYEAALLGESRFGKRYAIDGPLQSPDGRNPRLRVIWFIESGKEEPKFVTAHPLRKDNA